jgi:hypothetical protein
MNAWSLAFISIHVAYRYFTAFYQLQSILITSSSAVPVPARIVSFSREIVTPWKKDITLPCRKVGIPVPQAVWRLQDRIMETNGRKQVQIHLISVVTTFP